MVLCGSSTSRRYRGIHNDIGEQELRFISRHKPLEGVLLPESPPWVLHDPPFIQCLVPVTLAESSGEDPGATGGLVSNLPHPRVNKTKQHCLTLTFAHGASHHCSPNCHAQSKGAFSTNQNHYVIQIKTHTIQNQHKPPSRTE